MSVYIAKTFKNLLLMNHELECIDIFFMEHPWGKEIQLYANEVPRVMYGPTP